MSDLADARALVRSGNYDALELLYDDIPDTLSQLIRTAFVPQDGKKFIVADFSAIEARVLAWLAGEKWRMQVFADGKDIYCSSASQMFGVPVEKHGINGHLRQKGKIAELATGEGKNLVATWLRRFGRCAQKYGCFGDGTYRRGTSATGERMEKCQPDDNSSVVGYRQSGEDYGARAYSD